MGILRLIMIGDVVGDPGLEVLDRRLLQLINEYSADFVVVNGENAAGGFGLTSPVLEKLLEAGADAVTGGNHIWEQREFWPVLDSDKPVLRPLNYPEGSPGQKTVGKGWTVLEKKTESGAIIPWVVVNLQGREFMTALDCPFRAFDSLEAGLKNPGKPVLEKPVIIADFHAESSREKEALAYYLDGRVSAAAGTHTHVQTADERILPKGTAYITDLGMTGNLGGVIGMKAKICIDRARSQVLYRMEVASPDTNTQTAIQGIIVEIDEVTRKAVSIKRINS